MPLVPPQEVRSLLVCPRCHAALVEEPGALRCSAPGCALGQGGAFPVLTGHPVLVDFADSVLPRPAEDARRSGPPRAALDRLPSPLRRLWRPANRVAARNTARLLAALPGPAPTVLVVGGATVGNGVEVLYTDPRPRLIAFDIAPGPLTQFTADAHRIPLPDGCVDAVVVQAVLEHVLEPARVVAEIHRVLGEGGLVYAETPFLQQVHAGPYDFTRFTLSGHRHLFRHFTELDAGAVAGPGTQLVWSLDHLVRGLTRSAVAGRLARGLLGWLRLLDAAVPAPFAEDGACACWFLGRKREDGMSPQELIRYYRGAQRRAPGRPGAGRSQG